MNSPRDLDSVLNTINHYQIGLTKYFCPNSSYLSTIYNSFKSKALKWSNLKTDTTFKSQFFITRNFVARIKKIPSL